MAFGFTPGVRAFGATAGAPSTTFTAAFGAFHCPICGYSGPIWHSGPSPSFPPAGWLAPALAPFPAAIGGNIGGLGGLRSHGGGYTPEYVATGLPSDEEIVEMIYDTMDLDPLIPYDADIDVESDAGTVTLTGTVSNPTVKHSAGDDAWWTPGVVDVINKIKVSGHRRVRSGSTPTQRETPAAKRPTARKKTTTPKK